MEKHLGLVAKSYDRHFVEYGKEDGLSYDNLPYYIISDPDYLYWKNEQESGREENRRIELKDYLSPAENMNFIQLGCSVNLKTRGYYKWPSAYHGVDISNETIQALKRFVGENNIAVGSLHCGSMHKTPFAESCFDIGECIGALEYYEEAFVLESIKEFHRILKPGGRFVLDIPNIKSPSGRMMMLIEECMGRPDKFNMPPEEFEDMIKDYFEIEDSDRIRAESRGEGHTGMVYFYCLKCKK
ncbi:MAG: class I SAM-dependent methyltransferase [Oscillospiraceae bacterium]|nr:class I SAM-dependent methyltransferase [Oscillospiraceae bacterium]